MRLAKHRDATVRHYRAALGVLLCRWWSWAIPEQKILRAGIRARPGATLRALEFHVSGRRWGYAHRAARLPPRRFRCVAHRARQLRPPSSPMDAAVRSEEHTSELQSLMRTSYAVFCLKKKKTNNKLTHKEYSN